MSVDLGIGLVYFFYFLLGGRRGNSSVLAGLWGAPGELRWQLMDGAGFSQLAAPNGCVPCVT